MLKISVAFLCCIISSFLIQDMEMVPLPQGTDPMSKAMDAMKAAQGMMGGSSSDGGMGQMSAPLSALAALAGSAGMAEPGSAADSDDMAGYDSSDDAPL